MNYDSNFRGWGELTIKDLVLAYRKAKADCFFENTFPSAIKFAEYEQHLLENLESLLKKMQKNSGFGSNKDLIGDFRLLPKKLTTQPKNDAPKNGHVHFSSSDRAFKNLLDNFNITPEFRIVGDFPVNSHVISALWINMIGHKLDSKLEDNCYGARLKRICNDELFTEIQDKPFHIRSIGSFTPYFQPYQKWRNDGLKAIRDELEKDKEIIAVSLDLKSYYHLIDPSVLTSNNLYEILGIELDDNEIDFTTQLGELLQKWADGASKFGKKITNKKTKINGGLVIGLTASRVLSNVLLHYWDRLIFEKLSPIHYGRYVDDMFLVMKDPGNVSNNQEFMEFLQEKLGKKYIKQVGSADKKLWEIQQGKKIQGKTKIYLQSDKQKLFLLKGRAGLDLLDSIEKEIYELSSEHRLMPSPDQLEDSTAARVLSASGNVGDNADTLRRADGLTIRRLSWSLQLRHVETLAKDLPPQEWKEQREEFYQFAHNHILRPDNLFAHFTYLPRLLGFAISMNEWQHAEQIAHRAYKSIEQLQGIVTSGCEVVLNGSKTQAGENIWGYVKGTLAWLFIDATTRYYHPDKLFLGKLSSKEGRLSKLFLDGIFESFTSFQDMFDLRFDLSDFNKKAPLVALADLAREPYKQILKSQSAGKLVSLSNRQKGSKVLKVLGSTSLIDIKVLKDFLTSTRNSRLSAVEKKNQKQESYLPYLFPTRPLTPSEISELAPETVGLAKLDGTVCVKSPSVIWAKYTQALRGIWIKPTLVAKEQDKSLSGKKLGRRLFIKIGTEKKHKIIVALTNLKTTDNDWAAMACNKPNLSRERYQRISKLVNETIKLSPKPDYVIFPELSIPLQWVNSVATRLNAAGISLIAGTEYRHMKGDQLLSEAVLALTDNRLGYTASVKIWQPKLNPAVGEDQELIAIFGKSWALSSFERKQKKPVYIHNGVHFGVMICSELQDSKARIGFQGNVDALIALSWNQDLETFASLIESSALDIHAYTILVNNRKYGDSRVRSPAKESFMRDIARVRGGDNDFVVAATLDIDALRSFQSRAKRWPQEGDKFKPVPGGYNLKKSRKKSPPK